MKMQKEIDKKLATVESVASSELQGKLVDHYYNDALSKAEKAMFDAALAALEYLKGVGKIVEDLKKPLPKPIVTIVEGKTVKTPQYDGDSLDKADKAETLVEEIKTLMDKAATVKDWKAVSDKVGNLKKLLK